MVLDLYNYPSTHIYIKQGMLRCCLQCHWSCRPSTSPSSLRQIRRVVQKPWSLGSHLGLWTAHLSLRCAHVALHHVRLEHNHGLAPISFHNMGETCIVSRFWHKHANQVTSAKKNLAVDKSQFSSARAASQMARPPKYNGICIYIYLYMSILYIYYIYIFGLETSACRLLQPLNFCDCGSWKELGWMNGWLDARQVLPFWCFWHVSDLSRIPLQFQNKAAQAALLVAVKWILCIYSKV